MRKAMMAFAMIGTLSAPDTVLADGVVSITVRLTNDTVKQGDPIRLELVMTNDSSEAISFAITAGAQITDGINNFSVVDQAGIPVKKLVTDPVGLSVRRTNLAPGEEIHEIDDLGEEFDMKAAGIYYIQVGRSISQSGNLVAIKSNMTSATVLK
jgi:hypothetical protein